MSARNPKTHCRVHQLMVPATVSSTQTLNNTTPNLDVDTLGFTHALVIAYAGATITLVGDTVTVQMKETATPGSAYANISGAAMTAITGTGDNATKVGEISLLGRQRYLSATATAAGTPGHVMGIIIVLFNPEDSVLTATANLPTGETFDFSV